MNSQVFLGMIAQVQTANTKPFLSTHAALVQAWIINYPVDGKCGISRAKICGAVLVKRCHDDLRTKLQNNVKKTA